VPQGSQRRPQRPAVIPTGPEAMPRSTTDHTAQRQWPILTQDHPARPLYGSLSTVERTEEQHLPSPEALSRQEHVPERSNAIDRLRPEQRPVFIQPTGVPNAPAVLEQESEIRPYDALSERVPTQLTQHHWSTLPKEAFPATEDDRATEGWERKLRTWQRMHRLDREQRGLPWNE
jgi:hypothetical protein